jgi:putative methionine-R-sulfoxide reductase with GAF domain
MTTLPMHKEVKPMTKDEFLALDNKAQLKYLNEQAAKGLDGIEIPAALGMTKKELEKIGFYFVKNKYMLKPMRGYQTTMRSGNEEEFNK